MPENQVNFILEIQRNSTADPSPKITELFILYFYCHYIALLCKEKTSNIWRKENLNKNNSIVNCKGKRFEQMPTFDYGFF